MTLTKEQRDANIRAIVGKARIRMRGHLDEFVRKGDVGSGILAANRFENAVNFLLGKCDPVPDVKQPIQLSWTP